MPSSFIRYGRAMKKLSPTQLNVLCAFYNAGGSGDSMLLSIYGGNVRTRDTLLDSGFIRCTPYGKGDFRLTKEGRKYVEKNCPLKEDVDKVCAPTVSTKCWATVGLTFIPCSKDRREGKLTCWHHRGLEEWLQKEKKEV